LPLAAAEEASTLRSHAAPHSCVRRTLTTQLTHKVQKRSRPEWREMPPPLATSCLAFQEQRIFIIRKEKISSVTDELGPSVVRGTFFLPTLGTNPLCIANLLIASTSAHRLYSLPGKAKRGERATWHRYASPVGSHHPSSYPVPSRRLHVSWGLLPACGRVTSQVFYASCIAVILRFAMPALCECEFRNHGARPL
jgi:hypothetical protein